MERNELYPIFLKVNQLDVLIIGGGNVGLEKLGFLLKSSPNANVEVISKDFIPELKTLAAQHPHVKLTQKAYEVSDLEKRHMVIGCTDDLEVNLQINQDAKAKHLIVNIADTPDQCDFYLGGIVTKGHVKIAISTNGKSPTTAKRLRQFLEEVIPDNITDFVSNLNAYRKTLKGDFQYKVDELNKITEGLVSKKNKYDNNKIFWSAYRTHPLQ
ncbi:precorrin-2 dehydrogenase/sirohydrochlorin ferrochelatase family protein [Formosa haliotis]|uniref:precorrin-2 dehydrogenase/sirohydrochlorin ferrochelatase family protein n=1 Tax=Formosa haliotis TaxID=1555194 RepID=UPI0008254485|nr:bifunctional precorrin-2 dehydrogenase/sirohydrochlorin ferrochelatase [Formosa haliotis]